ncbi:hypothetical protein D9M72_475170 [compost metagenome]
MIRTPRTVSSAALELSFVLDAFAAFTWDLPRDFVAGFGVSGVTALASLRFRFPSEIVLVESVGDLLCFVDGGSTAPALRFSDVLLLEAQTCFFRSPSPAAISSMVRPVVTLV